MAKLTRAEFEERVRRLEGMAQKDPVGYRRRVGLIAALGYGFIFLIVLVLILAVGSIILIVVLTHRFGLALIKLGIPAFVLLVATVRALWVPFDRPEGIKLTDREAAPLLILVRRMTEALQAPRFHHVLLTPSFNAGVYQRPRFGLFGWPENYLMVGLPLLQSLSPEQFEAVLAHELGHLRGGHGRFGAWIYQINRTWEQLLNNLGEQGPTGAILRAFFRWYAPFFAASSFALRRQDEYEADRCAARLTSARTIADALCCLPVYDRYLDERYWTDLAKSVRQSPIPPGATYSSLLNFLARTPPPPEDAEKSLRTALHEETGMTDTHPSLTDRLKALGEEPRLCPTPPVTAAQRYFGHHLPELATMLDNLWLVHARPLWETQHKEALEKREKLNLLNQRATVLTLDTKDAWWRAQTTEELDGEEAALPLYRSLQNDPDIGLLATFAIGRILLEQDDPEGVALVRQVIAREPDATLSGLALIHAYETRQGNREGAKAIRTEGMTHADKADDAEEERNDFGNARTRYLPHGVDENVLTALRQILLRFPDVDEAYLVRKAVVHFPEKPLYVFGVTLTHEWRRLNRDNEAMHLQNALFTTISEENTLPGEGFIVVMAGGAAWLKKSVEKVPGARIYVRSR
ncbi:MAG: M48 family metallopeptidase [Capsulimonadales bacterium]|nr:M48 family metallopeptidase [Capsulimonadales bacterium]